MKYIILIEYFALQDIRIGASNFFSPFGINGDIVILGNKLLNMFGEAESYLSIFRFLIRELIFPLCHALDLIIERTIQNIGFVAGQFKNLLAGDVLGQKGSKEKSLRPEAQKVPLSMLG